MKKYYNLVYSIASKYKNDFVDFQDLVQEGFIGLYKAYTKYNANKNVSFPTYAYFWIKKQILAFLNKQKKENFLSFDEVSLDNLSYFEKENITTKSDYEISLNNFSDLESEVINLSIKHELPLNKIAEILNIPREKARQIRAKALRKLKFNIKLTKSL